MKKGWMYGNTPSIFSWAGLILHNIIIFGTLMAKGYGFIDVSMRQTNYLFLKIILGYVIIFRFLRKRYEKKFGEFGSEDKDKIEFHQPYMQVLFCIYEYCFSSGVISCFWLIIFYE